LKSVLKRSNRRVILLNKWKNNKSHSLKKIKFDETVYQRLILNDEQVDKILLLKDKDIAFEQLELIVVESECLLGVAEIDHTIDVLSLTTVDAPDTILNDQMIQPIIIQDQNYYFLNLYYFIMVVWHYFIV
jgi:hypothetical protein